MTNALCSVPRLQEGDCGSIVYLVDENANEPQYQMLGMFFGQVKSDPSVHQAVILSWNIKLLEMTHGTETLRLESVDDFQSPTPEYDPRSLNHDITQDPDDHSGQARKLPPVDLQTKKLRLPEAC